MPSRRLTRPVLLALAALALPAGVASAAPARPAERGGTQQQAAFSPAVQRKLSLAIRNDMTDNRLPGVVVGIWAPGRGTYVRAFGIGNRTTGAPARVSDHIRIASITKTFTATAVLQLVDQGRVSLDDHLDRYVSGVPNGDRITVRQLLGMTAGVYDFTSDERFGKQFNANPAMPFSNADFFAILRRHKPAFAPGTQAVYSDSNYYLLSLIVEKVTGKTIAQAITDQIIEPLGLRHTSFPATPAMPQPFAQGYFGGADGTAPLVDATRSNPAVSLGAGAMVSTLGDLRRWSDALVNGTLLSPGLQAQRLRTTPFRNPGGVSIAYGLGILKLGRFWGHNGAIVGYSSAMFTLPGKATFVVWGNDSSNFSTPATTIFFHLAAILYPDAE